MFYKITDAKTQSCHNGSMDWTPYLPEYIHTKGCIESLVCPAADCHQCKYQGKWNAGKWYKHEGELSMCRSGIHLTSEPFSWFKRGGRIFAAEYRGNFISDSSDKCCFAEVRLTSECGFGYIIRQASLWKGLASGANLRGADLRGAYLRGADLSDADLSDADLRGADLRGAYLRGADLSDADLSDADLRGADLRGAYLRGADLSDADLSDADLRGAYLRGADLSDADLSDADLRGAYLRGADLSDADLSDANLRGADLSDADLSDADLRGAYLSDDPHIKGYKLKNGRLWVTTDAK